LAAGQTAVFQGFQAKRAKRNGTAFVSQAAIATFMLFAIFLTFRLKHRQLEVEN
jgi:hypothetical protein